MFHSIRIPRLPIGLALTRENWAAPENQGLASKMPRILREEKGLRQSCARPVQKSVSNQKSCKRKPPLSPSSEVFDQHAIKNARPPITVTAHCWFFARI